MQMLVVISFHHLKEKKPSAVSMASKADEDEDEDSEVKA